MTAVEALQAFLKPHLGGWVMQYGRWVDGGVAKRYAVIKPSGGIAADLVRRPAFSLILVGAKGDAQQAPGIKADEIIEAARKSSGSLVFIQAGEAAYWATDDGRPVAEIAITTIQ